MINKIIRRMSLIIIPLLIFQLFALECLAEVAAPMGATSQEGFSKIETAFSKIGDLISTSYLIIGTLFIVDGLFIKTKGSESGAEFLVGLGLIGITLLPRAIDNLKRDKAKNESVD